MPTYNNALTDQPANRLAFPSSIGPVPRNEYLGALADFLAKSYSPERTQQMQGISQLLGMPAVSRTLDMMSYGDPLTTGAGGLGGTTRVKPDVLEAAMTVAPLGKPATMATLQAARLARQAAMATGRAGERYAERVVPQIMERGGLGAEMLQGLSQGARSNIVPVDVAKRIDMPVNLPTSKEFLKAVENEPSAQITNEGLLMRLRRMQSPEQSGAESVRTGVFYLPEGQASNLKHYKGKTGYGGAESIDGETLYKNPLFVKGATGGKAPESAYDQLAGKGAYQAMRDDVLKLYGYNSNQSQKVESVQGLLEKYNGLDSDDAYNMAYNIVNNSKGGNTLPYAIQENIVANAVRNAGHDAVLGFGKGKGDKGEFLSEVFDVRELNYPTPQGDFELMPKFQNQLLKNR